MSAALLLLQAAALAAAIGLWWGVRHNTLFHDSRWVVGKNTGKFVFYTFEFLLRPLEKGAVDLAQDMAFQEILYDATEGPQRRLASISFECRVAYQAYLWIEVRRAGPRALAARLSRREGYPGGFHQFGPEGDLVRFTPLDAAPPWSESAWERVELRLEGGSWRLLMNGRSLGSVADELPAAGAFGFRGSGRLRAPVRVRDVTLQFLDPATGRSWVERTRFSPGAGVRRALAAALCFSLALLLLRRWRRRLLGQFLQPGARSRLEAADEIGVSAATALAAVGLLLRPALGTLIPGALLAAELVFLGALAAGSRDAVPERLPPAGRRSLALFGLVLSLLAAAAVARHGEMAGRGGSGSTWWKMKNVHPGAYLLRPDADRPSPAFAAGAPLEVAADRPFFAEGMAYRGQRISVEFVLPPQATLDVVFQQQSFLTLGDPRGEELPLQRRLLRVTTRDGVAGGLATGTGKQPAPFLRIEGAPLPGGRNRLELASDERGVAVVLNGARTRFAGVVPLGYGETGLLAHEAPVTVTALRVEPSGQESARAWVLPLVGLAIPAAAVGFVWAILRCGGAVGIGTVAPLVLGGLLPLAAYLGAILPVDRDSLLLLTRERLAWLELMLIASAASLPVAVLFVRRRIRGGFVFFQLSFLVLTAAVLLFAVDRLAASRPELFKRFTRDETVLPGELVEDDPQVGPWYSRNRKIGANNFVWRQRFGAKGASLKAPGATRLFLMGGSQAWGSGAADSSSTFDQLLERRLRSQGLAVEALNAGVNGAGVSGVRSFYQEVVSARAPDILVLDIGLNDSANLASSRGERKQTLRAALLGEFRALLDLCGAAGVDVLLVLEPMCGETPLRPDAEYYAGLERIARERGVRVLAPQEALRDAERQHWVWWDTAHLAPFGHELMSRLLEPAVAAAVRARLASQFPERIAPRPAPLAETPAEP